jgi:hypothetical protein
MDWEDWGKNYIVGTCRYRYLIDKEVELLFADSEKTTARRIGILIDADPHFVTISNNGSKEVIPVRRVIRIKERKEKKNGK